VFGHNLNNDIKNSDTEALGSFAHAGAKRELTKTVWDSIRPVALALSGLYLLFAIAHLFLLPENIKMLMVGFACTTAIILFGLSILIRHLAFSPRLTYPICFFIIILTSLNSLLHLYLTEEIFQTTNLMLVIIGAGYFILSKRWYFGSLLLIILGWCVFVIIIPNKDGIVHFSIALFSVSLLATLFNLVRTHTLFELQKAKEQMEFMAKHDALTKLPNRWLFDEQTEQMLRLARRTKKLCAILMIDIDNFKKINDRYGHLIDLLLEVKG
jgi:predicted signal transduction protein with EAL and GGDEF domain